MGDSATAPEAIQALLAAGQTASLAGDWTSAKAAFQDALAIEESAEALAALGNVLWWLGETEASIDRTQRAYAAFRRRPDPFQAAFAAIGLYFVYRISLGNRSVAQGWRSRAASLVEEFELAPLKGWILLTQAHDSGDPVASESLCRQARELARRFSDSDLELSAISQMGASLIEMGRVREGVALLDEAMAAALGGEGTPNTVVYTSCNMISSCSQVAEVERAVQWIRAADEFTQRYGCPHLYTLCRAYYGKLLFATGKWDDAERELRAALTIGRTAEPAVSGEALASLAELRLAQGRIDEARVLLAGFEDHSAAASARAALHLALGEAAIAGEIARRRLRHGGRDGGEMSPYIAGESIALENAALLDLLAEAELRQGRVDEATAIGRQLVELGEALDCACIVARGARVLGRALAADGDPAAAVSELERALDLFSRLGMPLEAGRSRLILARALAPQERELAIAEGRAALATFEELGAAPDADGAAAFLRSLGMKAARLGPRGVGVLTRREREVLDLLAEGATNRQIAERLFLSPKTAEHHVRSVLAKLDLSNRAEAAAYAVRHPGTNSATN